MSDWASYQREEFTEGPIKLVAVKFEEGQWAAVATLTAPSGAEFSGVQTNAASRHKAAAAAIEALKDNLNQWAQFLLDDLKEAEAA